MTKYKLSIEMPGRYGTAVEILEAGSLAEAQDIALELVRVIVMDSVSWDMEEIE